jgi:hypothetical protein
VRVLTLIAGALIVGTAATATAASTPSYTITFTGTATEHHLDTQQNIQDSGLCDSAEHVDVTATIAWSTSFPGFRTASRSALAQPAQPTGSQVSGSDVKDACGLPLDQAPPGWLASSTCSSPLISSGSPSLTVESKTKTAMTLALAAPPTAVPVGVGCPLNIRNDQLATHVVVPLKKLTALKKRKSLSFAVGITRPGPGDYYVPAQDCSQPTKPYEGYRTDDHCQDALSWSGTVTVTRVS